MASAEYKWSLHLLNAHIVDDAHWTRGEGDVQLRIHQVGQAAPDFELMDENKNVVKLSDLRGRTVVLLFYPMDFSPTCTTEHCTFGPQLPRLQGAGKDAVIFGVSTDHPFSHAAFKKQYNIPYSLLADPTRKMAKAYEQLSAFLPPYAVKHGDETMVYRSVDALLEQIYKLAEKGLSIQRYKGLGEMNPEQLWETTMNPETRRLLQVTIQDGVAAEEIFTTLMGDQVEPRRIFIQENALDVKNLDI